MIVSLVRQDYSIGSLLTLVFTGLPINGASGGAVAMSRMLSRLFARQLI